MNSPLSHTLSICIVLLLAAAIAVAQQPSTFFVQQNTNLFSSPGVLQPFALYTVHQGKLFSLFGGNNCGANSIQVGISANEGVTWKWLGPSNINWPSSGLYPIGSAAVSFGGMLVVVGGTTCNRGWFNYVWSSVDGQAWSVVTANWQPRSSPLLVVVSLPQPQVYLLGGGSNAGNFRDVWFTSTPTSANSWTQAATPGWQSLSAASATASGRIMAIDTSGTVWISDVGVQAWSMITPQSPWFGARTGPSLVNVQGSMIMVGGSRGSVGMSDVWVSGDEGTSWSLLTSQSGFGVISYAQPVAIANALIVVGGNIAGGPNPSCWIGYL